MKAAVKPPEFKIYRKLWHMFGIIAPLIYRHYLERSTASLIAGICLALAVIYDVSRLTIPAVNSLSYKYLGILYEEKEKKTLNTSTYYLISIFLCVFFFEKNVAIIALMFLSIGDPMAAIIGSKYGTIKILNKSIQGSIACFLACFVCAQFLLPLQVAFWAAVCATLFEALSSKINDNISIPIFSGLAMTLLGEGAAGNPPLFFIFIIFKVYLIFVVITSIVTILLRHIILFRYGRETRELERGSLAFAPSISVIQSLRGNEQGLADNIRALLNQKYSGGDVEFIFVSSDPAEPGMLVAQKIKDENPDPGFRIKFVTSVPHPTRLEKINNLIKGSLEASGEILIFIDSDVRPDPQYLMRMAAPFRELKTGIVTSIPSIKGVKNMPAALQSIENLYLATSIYYPMAYLNRLDTALSASIAIRRRVLEEAGGLEAVEHQIAGDHALAKIVAGNGYQIHLTYKPVDTWLERISFREWWQNTHRINVLFKTYTRHLYPVFLFQSGGLHALVLFLMNRTSAWSLALLAAVLGGNFLSMLYLTIFNKKDARLIPFLIFVPLLSLAELFIWSSAYFSSMIYWKGVKIFVEKNGVPTVIFRGTATSDAAL